MNDTQTPAVAFAAKSTEDKHGSISTQLEDARALAEREKLDLSPEREFHDEAASAFRGNRGPELAKALAEAERLANVHGGCALIVQHSDRLARGDGKRAKHLVEYALWAMKTGVTIRSVQDPQTFASDGMVYAALMGDRNTEDSKRKSESVRDGLRRRKERGQPVGPVPLGYAVKKDLVDGNVITARTADPTTVPTVARIFDLLAAGHSPGSASRVLNGEGPKTRRGGLWNSRAVRGVVENRSYLGENGYPKLIEGETWEAANRSIKRMDPAGRQRRKGGRRADEYVLKGLAFCHLCGRPLYTRRLANGRMYLCANVRQATGLCTAQAIPASAIEGHVLNHLEAFVGSAEAWLLDRVRERDSEREQRVAVLDELRNQLSSIDRRRDRAMADYEAALGEHDPNARIVLEVVAKIDSERGTLTDAIADAEAVIGEWQDASVDDRCATAKSGPACCAVRAAVLKSRRACSAAN